ncbi:MAG: hypothetical protein JO372_06605 [Solirubrobacterales bacterium]|nr:hypothetical protein [Solirubrobacterales bacterium]
MNADLSGVGEEVDCLRRRHDHPLTRRQTLDPLIIGERRDARLKLLVARLQLAGALDRAADARAELELLNLHRDDPRQHQAEQRDPGPTANDPVQKRMIGKPL